MLGLIVVMGLVSRSTASRINGELVDVTRNTARRLQIGGTIDAASSNMLAGMRGIVLFTYGKRPAMVQTAAKQFEAAASTWQEALHEVRPLLVTDEGRQLTAKMQDHLDRWKSVIPAIEEATSRNQPDEALKIAMAQGLPIYQENARDTDAFRQLQDRLLASQRANAASVFEWSRWVEFLIFGLSVAAGAFTLFVIRRSSILLRRATAELSESSRQVAGAAAQIASASQLLAQGAADQAGSVEETSASTEEMSATTKQNAQDASSAAELMAEASEIVRQANQTLEEMESSMKEINTSSGKIAGIIRVIDEIAFQTNILALNAAVEAARAGDAGMGFAVVADEVRNLAQRSAQAAKDTAGMIEESIARSKQGQSKVERVSAAIEDITEKSTAVNRLIGGLRASSSEQATGVEQISIAIAQVQAVAQNAAASAEQTASAGEELNSQAAALQELVNRMEQLVGTAS